VKENEGVDDRRRRRDIWKRFMAAAHQENCLGGRRSRKFV
jgi:hypothetical protein